MLGRAKTTDEVRAVHQDLTRYLLGHFRRTLSMEELHDVAAEALAEADRATQAGQQIEDLERWLRRAAWRNALDCIRRVQGEGKVPRARPGNIDDHLDRFVDSAPGPAALEDVAAHGDSVRALAGAFEALRPDEQRVVRLRFFDELDVPEILQLLGCTRHQYENLHKRALRKLRDALVEAAGDSSCAACRTLVLQGAEAALDAELVARRDAHLSGCLACRAFSARQAGLIAALPLPALPVLDRVVARVQAQLAGMPDATQPAEAVVGSVAVAGTAAAGTGVAGGGATLFGMAGATKTLAVVCSAGAVTATVCVAPPIARKDATPTRQEAKASTTAAEPRPPAPTAVPQAPAARVAKPTASVGARTAPDAEQEARAARKAAARAREVAREKARQDASPFLPESAAEPEPHVAPGAGAPARAAVVDSGSSSGPSPASAAQEAQPAASSFSGEFTP